MTFHFGRLADYFTAVAALDATEDAEKQRAIAALLGLGGSVEAPARAADPTETAETFPVHSSSSRPASALAVDPGMPAPEQAPRRPRKQATLRYTLTPIAASPTRPDWLEHVAPLQPPRAEVRKPPPPASLLAQRWSRAILSTAMSRDTVTNAIDIDAVVDAVARGVPVQHVPRRVVPTLSGGVQVLVDRGPAAAPFLEDQELLVRQIGAVAGRNRVQALRFNPSREFIAGTGARYEWRDYFALTPPPPAVTIVVLSDLGITVVPHDSNALMAEWRDFLMRIRTRGNRVLAFVPYGPSRWPSALRGLVDMATWDRTTTVRSVRRLFGHPRARRLAR